MQTPETVWQSGKYRIEQEEWPGNRSGYAFWLFHEDDNISSFETLEDAIRYYDLELAE